MILARHVVRLVAEVVRFGAATRRVSLVVLVVAGLTAIALVIAAQTVAPFVLYPFA